MHYVVSNLSVAQAAERLGVGVPRSTRGSRTVHCAPSESAHSGSSIELLTSPRRRAQGTRSSAVGAICLGVDRALCESPEELAELSPVERSRAEARLNELLRLVAKRPVGESAVRRIASALRLRFRNRAVREPRRGAAADLPRCARTCGGNRSSPRK